MKKALALAAALVLAASPAVAQEAPSSPAAQSAVAAPAAAPSIWVSQEEIRQRVAASEELRENAQLDNTQWWYLVAAIALGVILPSLILD